MRIYNTEIKLAERQKKSKPPCYDWGEKKSRKIEGEALALQVIAKLQEKLIHGPRTGEDTIVVQEPDLFSPGAKRLHSTSLHKLWGAATIVRDWSYRHGLTVSLKKSFDPETKELFCYLVISRPTYRHRLVV